MRKLIFASLFACAGLAFAKGPATLFDFTVADIDGKPQPLAVYKHKVVLVVNTASQCGFTPQYAGLEKLYEDYRDKGLVILGFPSNDFGGQEPGTEKEIKTFCERKFHVTFPMFQKVKTKGTEKSAVYQFLTATQSEPQWNFYKYLVGKDGLVRQSFGSRVTPDSKELRAALDAALKE